MFKSKFKIALILFAIMMMCLPACNSQEDFEKNAYLTISTAAEIKDMTMTLAAEKFANGELTQEQWNKVSLYCTKLATSGQMVASLMVSYKEQMEKTGDVDRDLKEKITVAVKMAIANKDMLKTLLQEFGFTNALIEKL